MTTKSMRYAVCAAALAAAMTGSGCGKYVREGRSPVQLVINSLGGVPGDISGGEATGTMISDVLTDITTPAPCTAADPCHVVVNDTGEVEVSLLLKDQGTEASPASPSALNQVTITRYRVEYARTDGRNQPGVDVPYPFDSAITFTVPTEGTVTAGFELVRINAKREAPLAALANSRVTISTIATVTFYGRDLVGNDISVSGQIGITFGDVIRGS